METIKDYVEQIIRLTGVSGNAVPIVRHVLLVLVTILLAWAAGALCRKILIPVVHFSSPSSIRSTNLNYLPVRPFANISAHFAAY